MSEIEIEPYVTTTEVAVLAGVSYRVLDYWVRKGYLRPENPRPGSGYRVRWSTDLIEQAKYMGLLVEAGVTPEAAARALRDGGRLSDWVTVLVDEG